MNDKNAQLVVMEMSSRFDQNIRKAEEWARNLKDLLPTLKHKEYVKEHIELLEWLIEHAKKNGA